MKDSYNDRFAMERIRSVCFVGFLIPSNKNDRNSVYVWHSLHIILPQEKSFDSEDLVTLYTRVTVFSLRGGQKDGSKEMVGTKRELGGAAR